MATLWPGIFVRLLHDQNPPLHERSSKWALTKGYGAVLRYGRTSLLNWVPYFTLYAPASYESCTPLQPNNRGLINRYNSYVVTSSNNQKQ